MLDHAAREALFGPKPPSPVPIRIMVEVLPDRRGILTPNCCQICRKPGPGIVAVRGLNGRLFSAHRWPCASKVNT